MVDNINEAAAVDVDIEAQKIRIAKAYKIALANRKKWGKEKLRLEGEYRLIDALGKNTDNKENASRS